MDDKEIFKRMDEEQDENKKHLYIFGTDVAQIPCFRNSFLYGISSGIAGGLVTFLGTSRPQFSTHCGFGTFMVTTLCYWFYCRLQSGNIMQVLIGFGEMASTSVAWKFKNTILLLTENTNGRRSSCGKSGGRQC